MKTAEDFKRQAKKLNLDGWEIGKCEKCNKDIYFSFSTDYETVFLSNWCTCYACGWLLPTYEVSWQTVAWHFVNQGHPDYINKMIDFWRFEESTK